MCRYYLAAILNVFVAVFVLFVFEVTTTVAVHKTPGVKLEIVTALVAAVVLDLLSVNTEVLSTSLVTLTSIVTPSLGKADVTFTLIAWVPPIAP